MTVTQVLEFLAFRERLDSAHTRAVARSEKQLMDLISSAQHVRIQHSYAVPFLLSGKLIIVFYAFPQGGFDAAVSLLDLARDSLPLDEVPEVAGTGPKQMRFNDDLPTRPAWYPPSPNGPTLAPSSWWQSRSMLRGQGLGRRWWAFPESAESLTHPDAEVWRLGNGQAARARWLIPHALASVTHVLPMAADSQPSAKLSPPVNAIDMLMECYGFSTLSSLRDALRSRAALLLDQADETPYVDDTNLLLFATLAWASTSNAEVLNPSGPDMSHSSLAEELCVFLSALTSSIVRKFSEALHSEPPSIFVLLPGSLLNMASNLVSEQLQWLSFGLQVIKWLLKA